MYNVRIPAVSGEMGVSSQHAHTFAELNPGVVTISKTNGDAAPLRYVVGSGTMMITENGCDVSVAEAIPAEHIDHDLLKAKYQEIKAELNAASSSDDEVRKATAQASLEIISRIVRFSEPESHPNCSSLLFSSRSASVSSSTRFFIYF